MSRDQGAHGAAPSLEEKRETLARLIREKAARRRRPPLTSAQERMWFLQQLYPDSNSLNVAWVVGLEGDLAVAVLEATVSHVVERHEALRTTFSETGDALVQVIAAPAPVPLPVIDLETVPRSLRDRVGERIAGEQIRRPFDLERGPLLRVALLRKGRGRHVLILTVHHIVTDGWSMVLLAREVTAIYEAFAAGRPSPLPKPEVQYADFALRQRRQLSGELFDGQLAYWKGALAGAPPEIALPADRRRPRLPSSRAGTRAFDVPADVSAAVKGLAQQRGVTEFMTLLALFQAFLSRVGGQRDLVVASPIQGRKWVAAESLIGLFVNTLCFRAVLAPATRFSNFLEQVRTTAVAAYAHQDLPFERLVEELRPERDLSRTPLSNVLFVMQAEISGSMDFSGLSLEVLDCDVGMTAFDLEMNMRDLGRRLDGWLTYSEDLFDATTIRRLLGHFRNFLAGVAEDARRPLAEIALLGAGERHQLLCEWNDAEGLDPQPGYVHRWFEREVDQRPDSVALTFGDGRLTYRTLDRRANRLAWYLRGLGVGPDVPVAVAMERSLELMVALLGVLKAGGAYLPLDTSYPRDRLNFMLEDALAGEKASVLLTREATSRTTSTPAEAVDLSREWPRIARESAERPSPELSPDNLAYLIYTSGSTGRPKGVMNTHRGICNRLLWMQEAYRLTGADRVMQKTPLSFDVSVWELFWPLMFGAEMVLARPEGHKDSEYLAGLIERQRVTTLHFVPSMLQVFVEEARSGWCPTLARVVVSGEALPCDLAERFFDCLGGAELHNLYGPTEAAVDVTFHRCGRADAESVPIGRPIANVSLYVAVGDLWPAQTGGAGELLLGGVALARGYLGRPELSAEKFVPDPFARRPGERLYRTGDLTRFRTDGEVEFLGRIDHQVKVRGQRVELGEIEEVLARQPAVRDVVVVWRGERLTAYAVAAEGEVPEVEALRGALREKLPEHMVPAAFVVLDEMPLSPNGKVDRRALPEPSRQEARSSLAPSTRTEKWLAELWAEMLGHESVGLGESFFELGGHSLMLARVRRRLKEQHGVDLPLADLFRFPTLEALAGRIDRGTAGFDSLQVATRTEKRRRVGRGEAAEEVAVVGLAGRFPGADDVEQFWRNLCDGVEAVTYFTEEELLAEGWDARQVRDPRFVGAAAVIDGAELFDAAFFDLSPREAQVMDPQHRLFLENAVAALEDAGYGAEHGRGAVGVFAGASVNSYFLRNLASNTELAMSMGSQQLLLANEKDHLATRVSYKLNLKGPAVSVQTACSTSLVAVHLACQSLLRGECDMALAGGVSVASPRKGGYLYLEGSVLSPDGHCRAFDADGRGTVTGEGVGIVALKRLDEALADGDPIRAVIKATALNNDGADKVGYTAPSVDGQAAVIAEAQEMAGVDPATIGYVEAHGTGTRLGDPIEVAALEQVFRSRTIKSGFCALGSVKTNIGHLDAAAGVAGLIKAVLAVERGQVPPSLNFDRPNPEINFAASPFYVATELSSWPLEEGRRRAGVSSFGMGGTNVHALLEEAPPREAPPDDAAGQWHLLLLSARSMPALKGAMDRMARHLRTVAERDLADVAYTCQVGRRAFEYRSALVSRSPGEAADALARRDPELVLTAERWCERPEVAFLFPGLGEHFVGMARGLYDAEPVFRDTLSECARILRPELGLDLLEVIYPPGRRVTTGGSGPRRSRGPDLLAMLRPEAAADPAAERLNRTALAQPALFAVEFALARLCKSWGITPGAMLGYSLGEYVAACLAGVFSLEAALTLVARRARMIDELPRGAMLAVPVSEDEARARLGARLSISAVNGPELTVVAGPPEEVEFLEASLAGEGIASRRLESAHAFHSTMMQPIADRFRDLVGSVERRAPTIPYLSNVTGQWNDPKAVTDPDYWVEHLCRPVRFADGVRELWKGDGRLLLEVGPGQSLSSLALQNHGGDRRGALAFASLPGRFEDQDDRVCLLRSVGKLWLAGARIDWEALHGGAVRRRLRLPGYSFERERHWIEPARREEAAPASSRNPQDWGYEGVWAEVVPPRPAEIFDPDAGWLLFLDGGTLGRELARRLAGRGAHVVTVEPGDGYSSPREDHYVVDPRSAGDFRTLAEAFDTRGFRPRHAVHMWLLSEEELGLEAVQELGFLSLVDLVRELARKGAPELELTVVTNRLHGVDETERPEPGKATVLGAIRGFPVDMPSIHCRGIDLEPDATAETALEPLFCELLSPSGDDAVALRGDRRLARSWRPVPLTASETVPELLRERAVYWITGGLGGLGLVVARLLARTLRARLLLTGRRLPAEGDPRLEAVAELEKLGSEVLCLAADVADRDQMRRALGEAERRFGPVRGVIHAAGVPGSGLVQRKTREMAAAVLAPKVTGASILVDLFRGTELDFMVFFSSLSSLVGGLGEADYCGANAFLDALATSRPLGETPVVSVNWDGWQEVGLGADAERRLRADGVDVDLMGHGILPDEGAEVFYRLLARPAAQVAVATSDLESRKGRPLPEETWSFGERRPAEAAVPGAAFGTLHVSARGGAEETLAELWRELLGVGEVGAHENFFELGGHSLLLVQMQKRLAELLGVELPAAVLFQHPTIRSLADHLEGGRYEDPSRSRPVARRQRHGGEVAILSMVGRFPGAAGVEELWQNLCAGVESISRFTDEELLEAGTSAEALGDPRLVKAGGFLEGADLFDAAFFGLSPREAQIMDPQHRLFLECAAEALEAAGYGAADGRGSVGVFGGSGFSTYLARVVDTPGLEALATQALVSNDKFHLTTQVSYKLNLMGPSLTVETACSTAMVAVHLACRSLLSGECDLALAGGVSVPVPLKSAYLHEQGGILSPDGHCRAFDASGGGTVFGRGVGVVLLKPLEEALADGDPIHAVIKGTAINNDGSLKVGFTAPSVDGQAKVVREAQERAGVDPSTVGYVEAHATGTRLGDPIEVAALNQVFGRGKVERAVCALGSVKTNIGHLDTAAGIASLIKGALAVERGRVPPNLHFDRPNPEIDFAGGPFFVPTELGDWPRKSGPRRAGVSSFGFGGTNAHAVLEEAPDRVPGDAGRDWQLLVLSAKSSTALERSCSELAEHLRRYPELEPDDVAYTLQMGRERREHRRVVVCRGLEEGAALLAGESAPPGRVFGRREELVRRPVAFAFPGQGAQYVGMGRELYETESVYREEVDRCSELLTPHLGKAADLRHLIFASPEDSEAADRLRDTAFAQPALFVVEYALARLWMTWGAEPRAMLGHSIGEYVAACLAGVFSLDDALALVTARGRMMQELPLGSMIGVSLPAKEVEARLPEGLAMAAVNAPDLSVVSGLTEVLEEWAARLAEEGVEHRRLHTSHAFHSPMMEPILAGFERTVAAVELRKPVRAFLSNLTGTWIEERDATDPAYWAGHLRGTVRFADNLACLFEDPKVALVEVGPGSTLTRLVRRQAGGRTALASLPGPKDSEGDLETLLRTAGRLWLSGGELDWRGFHAGRRRCRVRLPTTPFERQRYWVEAAPRRPAPSASTARKPIGEWTHVPSWRQGLPLMVPAELAEEGLWLLFTDADGPGRGHLGRELAAELRRRDCPLVTVDPGESFERVGEASYRLDPGSPEGYALLVEGLLAEGRAPRFVLHLWSVTGNGERPTIEASQERGFFSLLYLAQALEKFEGDLEEVDLVVVADRLFDVAGGEALEPEKATVTGASRVVSQEVAAAFCRVVDPGEVSDSPSPRQVEAVLAEAVRRTNDDVIAYRGRRWIRSFEPLTVDAEAAPVLRRQGVYVITGGLGWLGSVLASYLAREHAARLVLIGRSGLPPRPEWPAWLEDHGEQDRTSRRIRKVLAMEEQGGEVRVLQADVADRRAMAEALAAARERFGRIDGVFHTAGVDESELLYRKTASSAARVLAPKLHGGRTLAELLAGEEVDFLVFYSSLSSVAGGIGMVDYSAANAFLDALAHASAVHGPRTLAVNWGAWEPEEVPDAEPGLQSHWGRDVMAAAIRASEGVELLARLLSQPAAQVVVSPRELAVEMQAVEQLRREQEKRRSSLPDSRPDLDTPYVGPRDEMEEAVVEVWQELLGITGIGVNDNFYELGGHSLLGMQAASRIRTSFEVELPLDVMLSNPTVAELSLAIVERQAESVDKENLAELFTEIEEMSEEEIRRMLLPETIP